MEIAVYLAVELGWTEIRIEPSLLLKTKIVIGKLDVTCAKRKLNDLFVRRHQLYSNVK